ncbi:hypothetical protein [Propionimicrobium lymphophilum]|nr:hypothetical protein [Propionimicrobium lymphophilum]
MEKIFSLLFMCLDIASFWVELRSKLLSGEPISKMLAWAVLQVVLIVADFASPSPCVGIIIVKVLARIVILVLDDKGKGNPPDNE